MGMQWNNSPYKCTSLTEVRQICLITIHITQIVFTSYQYNWDIRAKSTYFRIPHSFAITQRNGISDRKTEQDYIWTVKKCRRMRLHDILFLRDFISNKVLPSISETPILVMIAKCVPKTQRYVNTINYLPWAFKNLNGKEIVLKNMWLSMNQQQKQAN